MALSLEHQQIVPSVVAVQLFTHLPVLFNIQGEKVAANERQRGQREEEEFRDRQELQGRNRDQKTLSWPMVMKQAAKPLTISYLTK